MTGTANIFLTAINAHRAILGLPPLIDDSNAPVQRGSVLWRRLTAKPYEPDIDIPVLRKIAREKP